MLIKCKDCGNSVSEHANICPKCGCPVEMSLNPNPVKKLNPFEEVCDFLDRNGKRVYCSCGYMIQYYKYGTSLEPRTLSCPDCGKKFRVTWDDYRSLTVTPIYE